MKLLDVFLKAKFNDDFHYFRIFGATYYHQYRQTLDMAFDAYYENDLHIYDDEDIIQSLKDAAIPKEMKELFDKGWKADKAGLAVYRISKHPVLAPYGQLMAYQMGIEACLQVEPEVIELMWG